jgi:hypothetical protein
MLAPSLLKYFPNIDPDSTIMKLTPSGSYSTGGDTFSIAPSALADPNGKGVVNYPDVDILPSAAPVVEGNFGMTESGNSANITTNVIVGTTQANYKLQIFVNGTEVSAGAYPAGLLTGYFQVKVYW